MSTCTALPHFSKRNDDAALFGRLRKRVLAAVSTLPPTRKRRARLKAVLLPLLYLLFYFWAISTSSYLVFCIAYVFIGFMLVIIFLNLVHEACHDMLFTKKTSNRHYLLLFDAIGANSYMWKLRHVRLHHNYPNVTGWDSDIEKSKFLKVHPQDRNKLAVRFQHLLVVLYPLFITNWFLVRDFKDFFNPAMIVRKISAPPPVEFLKLFFFKLFFVAYLVAVPLLLTPFGWQKVVAAFFLLLFSAGLFALVVLIPPHVNTSNKFPEVDADMQLEQSWFMLQMITTNDVNGYNWFTQHVLGNYNFHIAHHLFPNISYVYAKEVTDEIKAFCYEERIPYRSYRLLDTFKNHYRLIRQNGRVLDFLKEDM